MNKKELKKLLRERCCFDMVSTKKNGNIICRRAFFYKHGREASDYEQRVIDLLTSLHITADSITSGEHWAAFKGGASIAKQSHWYVEIELERERK